MTEPALRTAGMPWYAREDYAAILALMEDPHVLAPAYDQWLAAAQNNEREAERAGCAWCGSGSSRSLSRAGAPTRASP